MPYLVGPFLLVVAIGASRLVLRRPEWLFAAVATGVVGAGFVWILATALAPTRPDRTCPACGAEDLVRLDPRTTSGVRCESCGHRAEDVSSFYLAEEEGPLEELVLAERRERRRRRASRARR